MHGTVSGRLACREPNLQNIPKTRGGDDPREPIRKFFVARPGYKLISCDYINLEAQLLAYETLDPILCDIFEHDLNLHDINTKSMFKIDETDIRWKVARRAAKIFFFGGISYGGGDYEIFESVSLEAPELYLTFAEFKAAKDNWMADHPAYVAWKNATIEEVMKTREVRTEFGRFRVFLGNDRDIGKQALDFKIQSPGASLVNRAMVRVDTRYEERKMQSCFVCQVHDQLVVEAPDNEVEEAAAILKEEMEKPFLFKGVMRKVPVDLTIGSDLGEV
jgi:DNA polymerase-1